MAEPPSGRPLISVVIPVHNAESYLSQCLDSVLAQTLKAIELIVVDDASGDTTPLILDRYSTADQRVKVITHPENRGVSAARNTGIEHARGRYLAFVDADDYVERSMLAGLYQSAIELDVDVLSCGLKVVDPNGIVMLVVDFPLKPEIRYEPSAVHEALHAAFATKTLWYPVRSLYSHELLTKHGLRFDEGIRKGEDSLFNLQALCFARGVACVRNAPYHYRKHPGSATARPLASESANLERLGEQVISFYHKNGFDSRADADFYAQVLRSDLPTALVRLRSHPEQREEVRALLESTTVRAALRAISVRQLQAPLRVAALLMASKWLRPSLVAWLLRRLR